MSSSAAIIGAVISFTGLAIFFSMTKKYRFRAIDYDTSNVDVAYLNEDNAHYYNTLYDEKYNDLKTKSKYEIYLKSIIYKFNLEQLLKHFEDRKKIAEIYFESLSPDEKIRNAKFLVNEPEEIYYSENNDDDLQGPNDNEILKMLKHLKFESLNPIFMETFFQGLSQKKLSFDLQLTIDTLKERKRIRQNLKNRVFNDINL